MYEGALDGDDPDLPNVMGSQTGNNYLPGPAALSDDDPATRIRISSAWAADWVAVLDGTPAATATSIKVTAVVTPVYVDPTDPDQYAEIKLSLIDYVADGFLSNYAHAAATAKFRVEAGQTRAIEWTIDETWLNGTHGNDGDPLDFDKGLHWYDTDPYVNDGDNGPHEFAAFRNRLLAGPGSTVGLYMAQYTGGHPYEIDVSKVRIEAVRPQ